MKAKTKPSGFIKRMVGASMALFAASLLLVSCELEDFFPDPEASPECQELHLKRFAAQKEYDAALKAYSDYVNQPLASHGDDYVSILAATLEKAHGALNQVVQEQRKAKCR